MNEFKTTLQELRVTKKLTQERIANDLNYNLRTYQEYERGHISIPFADIPKIARYFNVTADFLVGMTKEMQPQAKEFSEATGLSEECVSVLRSIREKTNSDAFLDIINQILVNPLFYRAIVNALNVKAIENKIKQELTDKGQQYALAVSIENGIGNMKEVITSGESYKEYLKLLVKDEARQLFETIMEEGK